MLKSLNESMLDLMQIIAEHNYITWEEAGEYTGVKRTGLRYLQYLEHRGIIDTFDTSLMPRKAYCLSSVGYNILTGQDRLKVIKKYYPSDYRISTFEHTIKGIKTRLIFSKHPYVIDYRPTKVITYYTYKEHRVLKGKLFDAEMYVKGKDRTYLVGIEVELTVKKWTSYFTNIINIFRYRKEVDYVCWICSSQAIIDLLLSTLNKVRDTLFRTEQMTAEEVLAGLRKYRFILWETFREDRLKAEWIKPDKTRIKLLPEVPKYPTNVTGITSQT